MGALEGAALQRVTLDATRSVGARGPRAATRVRSMRTAVGRRAGAVRVGAASAVATAMTACEGGGGSKKQGEQECQCVPHGAALRLPEGSTTAVSILGVPWRRRVEHTAHGFCENLAKLLQDGDVKDGELGHGDKSWLDS